MKNTKETWTISCPFCLTSTIHVEDGRRGADARTRAAAELADHEGHVDQLTVAVTGWRQLALPLSFIEARASRAVRSA
jgi:hypothetical protein